MSSNELYLKFIEAQRVDIYGELYRLGSRFILDRLGETVILDAGLVDGKWHYTNKEKDKGFIAERSETNIGVPFLKLTTNNFKEQHSLAFEDCKNIIHEMYISFKESEGLHNFDNLKRLYNKLPKLVKKGLPYFVKKKINVDDFNDLKESFFNGTTTIVIPAYNIKGELIQIQKINSNNGKKFFAKGLCTTGILYPIRDITDECDEVVICEGFSTGAAIKDLTSAPVIVAFNANNLIHVAKEFKRQYPKKNIIIAADNDHANSIGNVGINKASIALKVTGGGKITYPKNIKGTDWNDCLLELGLENAKSQFEENKQLVEENQTITSNQHTSKLTSTFKMLGNVLCKVSEKKDGSPLILTAYYGVIKPIQKIIDDDNTYYKIEFASEKGILTKQFQASDLTNGQNLANVLSASGSYLIFKKQGELICEYLSEYVGLNNIPTVWKTAKLGLIDEGLVLEHLSINTTKEYLYKKDSTTTIDDIKNVVNQFEIASQVDDDSASKNWIAKFSLGMSVASPFIKYFKEQHNGARIDRNPIVVFTGASNSGKTTLAKLAVSIWGNPSTTPLKIEASADNTKVGLESTFSELNGLTPFLDEVHCLDYSNKARSVNYTQLSYIWANGQSRVRGTKTNGTVGGESYSGVLMAAGEQLPLLKNAGSFNRQIIFDVNTSNLFEGKAEMARLIKKACNNSYGQLGAIVYKHIKNNWQQFINDYENNAKQIDLDSDWRYVGALAVTSWEYLYQALFGVKPQCKAVIIEKFIETISHQKESGDFDPHSKTWERLQAWMSQARQKIIEERGINGDADRYVETGIYYIGGNVAYFKAKKDDSLIIPMNNANMLKAVIGNEQGSITEHARVWMRQNKIKTYYREVGNKCYSTPSCAFFIPTTRTRARCIVIPPADNNSQLDDYYRNIENITDDFIEISM